MKMKTDLLTVLACAAVAGCTTTFTEYKPTLMCEALCDAIESVEEIVASGDTTGLGEAEAGLFQALGDVTEVTAN